MPLVTVSHGTQSARTLRRRDCLGLHAMADASHNSPFGHGCRVQEGMGHSATRGSHTLQPSLARARQPPKKRATMLSEAILAKSAKREDAAIAVCGVRASSPLAISSNTNDCESEINTAPRLTVNPVWLAHRDARDQELRLRLQKRTGKRQQQVPG
jgi:hypothetical protein